MTNEELMALERELAEALGWTKVQFNERINSVPASNIGRKPGEADLVWMTEVPAWARAWEDCGRLMVEHRCYPRENLNSTIFFYGKGEVPMILEHAKDHTDKDTAVRVAICRAVLAKLKG